MRWGFGFGIVNKKGVVMNNMINTILILSNIALFGFISLGDTNLIISNQKILSENQIEMGKDIDLIKELLKTE